MDLLFGKGIPQKIIEIVIQESMDLMEYINGNTDEVKKENKRSIIIYL